MSVTFFCYKVQLFFNGQDERSTFVFGASRDRESIVSDPMVMCVLGSGWWRLHWRLSECQWAVILVLWTVNGMQTGCKAVRFRTQYRHRLHGRLPIMTGDVATCHRLGRHGDAGRMTFSRSVMSGLFAPDVTMPTAVMNNMADGRAVTRINDIATFNHVTRIDADSR